MSLTISLFRRGRSRLSRGLSDRAAVALMAVLGLCAARLCAQAPMMPAQTATKTAVASVPYATLGNGSFELSSGPVGPPTPPDYHTYLNFTTENGWYYGQACGIAHRNSRSCPS